MKVFRGLILTLVTLAVLLNCPVAASITPQDNFFTSSGWDDILEEYGVDDTPELLDDPFYNSVGGSWDDIINDFNDGLSLRATQPSG